MCVRMGGFDTIKSGKQEGPGSDETLCCGFQTVGGVRHTYTPLHTARPATTVPRPPTGVSTKALPHPLPPKFSDVTGATDGPVKVSQSTPTTTPVHKLPFLEFIFV